MLAHNVYFSLKDVSPETKQQLVDACKTYLSRHDGIVFFTCGVLEPELNRPVNDRDFDVSLQIVFKDRASHDAYQQNADHNTFIEENHHNWEKVRVFDSEVTGI